MEAVIGSMHLSTVHQVAELLRKAKVSPNTTVITWARNKTDLILLRDFLEVAGHTNIVPSDQNCFLPLFHCDRNVPTLPNEKRLSLKLNITFPLLFPQHAGKTHRALQLVDAQQLRLETMKLAEFCFGQIVIEDWFELTA
jgi:hypothetical protein